MDANQNLADMLGYDVRKLIGMEVSQLGPPDSVTLILGKVRAKDEGAYRATAKRKDGTVIPVEIHAKSVEYGGRTLRIGSVREIRNLH